MSLGSVITNSGQNLALYRTFTSNPTQSAIVRFRIGGGTSTPAETDTAISKTFLINATNLNVMDATTGWLISGVAAAVTLNTTAGQRVEGTGALNFPTSDSGSATYYRTQVASSMSSTYHTVYFYNANVTNNLQNVSNAVSVVLGNNSTNTNSLRYDYARSSMSDGWNPITLYTPVFSVQSGTASIASISYFAIVVQNNSTMTTNNQRADIWKYGGNSNVFKTFEAGWPMFDTGAKTVQSKGYLTSVQANNYSITEWTLENSDGTPIMFSRDVTNALDKSTGEEVSIIWTDSVSQTA